MKNPNSQITTTQLARICHVSQGTVDRALNDRKGVRPATREKILKAARKYGYVPPARKANGRFGMIGIVLFDLYNEYFSRLLMCLEECAKRKGYLAVAMFSHNNPESEIDCLNRLAMMGVDGIVLCPLGQGAEYESYIGTLDIPVVTVGNRLENYPFIGICDRKAMYDSTRYVLSKAYDQIIYYSPPLSYRDRNLYAQTERYRGFSDAMEEVNMPYSVVSDRRELSGLTFTGRTAIICSTDHHALEVYCMMSPKYRISDELGIIGFDDMHMLQYLDKELSSVGYDTERIAELAISEIVHKQCETQWVEYNILPRETL